jgi:antitoxin MazE
MPVIKTQIVRIGNSRGIRLPKHLIEQLGFGTEVEVVAQQNQLVIRSASRPRQGWGDKFRQMNERGDDLLLDPSTSTEWDKSEWKW